jgi:hypothetical protein
MLSTAVRFGACSLAERLFAVEGGLQGGVLDCTRLAGQIGHIQGSVNPENKL